MTTSPKPSGQAPDLKLAIGGVSAAVWVDEYEHDDRRFETHKIRLSKSYKDADDNWRRTESFDRRDLGALLTIILELNQRLNLRVFDNADGDDGQAS